MPKSKTDFEPIRSRQISLAKQTIKAQFDEALKDTPYRLSFAWIHHQFAVDEVITERWFSTCPLATSFHGRDFVADPVRRYLAFKLREGQKDVQHEPSHTVRRIERLCDRNE